ncbi:putative ATP synthase subunit O mitochondrial isoform 5 [Scophthalmus maximus]|uniref:Oligomycin sensitivity conferral protein n=1 Tax=Scophthalmus maximus TaxID=52904 RepID=A0A2U9C6K8_SCOMX|nr:putative ATP synthase subunit O mitochondrial isoform 5 [Scophthalmus maximus]
MKCHKMSHVLNILIIEYLDNGLISIKCCFNPSCFFSGTQTHLVLCHLFYLFFLQTMIKDPTIAGIVMNPHVKRSIKQKTFSDALVKAKLSPITINLINVLADNGRLPITGDVIGAFGQMMSAHRGEVLCTVTTAQPLDAASLADLKVALKGFLQKGETIKLETKADSSILGGMVVCIGDKYVDMSTKTKIQKLTKIIRET